MQAPEWRQLDERLLQRMKDRLGAEFANFARLCETTGLLRKNFLALDRSGKRLGGACDPEFTCSMCATAVVSAANHYGGSADLTSARMLASWALLLEPSHSPALQCLATIADLEGDASAADSYRDKAAQIHEYIRHTDPAGLSAYERGLREALEAARFDS